MPFVQATPTQPSNVIVCDALGRVTWVSASFTELTGYTLADLRGRTPGSVLQGPLSDADAVARMHEAVHGGRVCRGVELVNYRRDGTPFRVRMDIEPQHDDAGRLTGFVSVQTDISDLDIDRAHLLALQRWFNATQHDPAIGLFERNIDTGEVHWDARLRALWDWPAEGPPPDAEQFHASVVEDDREATRRTWSTSLQHMGHGRYAYRIRTASRGVRWMQSDWVVSRNERGERVATGSVRDITEAMRARDAAETERTQLLVGAELADIGLVRIDLRTDVTQLNGVARRLFGLPDSGDVRAEQMGACVHPDDRPEMLAAWQRLIAGDTSTPDIRYRVCHPDGRTLHLLSRRRLLRDGDGHATEVVGAVLDVSAQAAAQAAQQLARQREQQLEAERDQSAALAAARTALMAAVSHEVRTPLNAIQVACEQLAADALLGATHQRWLDVLNEAGAHLLGLAEDLLGGFAHEAGRSAEASEPLSLRAKVDRSYRWLEGQAAAAGVALRVDPSVDGLFVLAPRRRLRQVLLNLVGNAIKYNRRGGWVRCRAVATEAGTVRVEVEDNGLGMTPEQVQRLFRPFDRLGRESGTAGPASSGFGLGLYLVERFMREMGGTTEVHSQPGVGTRVVLTLPRAADPALSGHAESAVELTVVPPPVARRRRRAPTPAQTVRLLLVDDDPVTATLLGAQLARVEGSWSLAAASDRAGALGQLARERPDIVLLDLRLGSDLGTEVLAALRDAGFEGQAVAYTGEADPAVHTVLRSGGFDAVWVKPLATARLRQRLQELTGGSAAGAAAGAATGATTGAMAGAITGATAGAAAAGAQTASSSTSNTSVAFGGITPPAPRAP
jgi:PAS domain S-box-containing protein